MDKASENSPHLAAMDILLSGTAPEPGADRAALEALAAKWAASDRQVDDPDDPTDVAYAAGVDWGMRIAAHQLRKLLKGEAL